MADPTQPDPSHKKLTLPGSKKFDPYPSLILQAECHFTANSQFRVEVKVGSPWHVAMATGWGSEGHVYKS